MLDDTGVTERYLAKVVRGDHQACWLWTGAISGHGHGRFWVHDAFVVIAHRFGYALAHGADDFPPVVAHACDEPLCQNPEHLHPSTNALNRAEWAWRRHNPGSPLRDSRGSLTRAVQLRSAARAGANVAGVAQQGLSTLDRAQSQLW